MNNISLQEQLETLPIATLKALSGKIDDLLRKKYKVEIVDPIEAELKEYFKTHKAGGFQIVDFSLTEDIDYDSIEISPRLPYIDEEYYDDKCDADLEAIGRKYGVRLGWRCSVYGK